MAKKDIEGDGIKWEVTEGGRSEYIRACFRENEKEEQVSACSIGLASLLNELNCVLFLVQFSVVSRSVVGKTFCQTRPLIITFTFGIKAK